MHVIGSLAFDLVAKWQTEYNVSLGAHSRNELVSAICTFVAEREREVQGAPELTRRACGVVQDVFNLRKEAADILDLYAKTSWTPPVPPRATTVDDLRADLSAWSERAIAFMNENAAANEREGLPRAGRARWLVVAKLAEITSYLSTVGL